MLYLLSVPIIFTSIGLTLYLIVVVYISVLGLTGPDAAGLPYMVILILFFLGHSCITIFFLFYSTNAPWVDSQEKAQEIKTSSE